MIQIETVGTYEAQWGEGPIWWQGKLLYVDIEKHMVLSYEPETKEEKSWNVGERVGTVVPRAQGGMVIAGDNGFAFLSEDGTLESIADPETEKKDNRFNDGKCSPDGNFFAGTISLVKREGDASLYCLDKEGEAREVYPGVTNSNGLCWNAAGDTLYYIDTPTRSVLAFDYKEGTISNPRKIIDTSAIDASPDGMAIDAKDCLWIAFCHGACVACFDPSTGEMTRKVDLPCLETTACAFGGENLDELYVTTGVHKTEVEKDAGRLFKITGLGVRGQGAFAYQG